MDFSVDDDFVRVGEKSYAVNKINSVEVRTKPIKGSRGYIVLWVMAAVAALVWLPSPASDDGIGFLLVAIGLAVWGWFSFKNSKDSAEYALLLVTSSGEATAVTTTDLDEITAIRREIERAMARR